ncbi:hypothetical protein S83_070541, partial [Arachis hypogaea]
MVVRQTLTSLLHRALLLPIHPPLSGVPCCDTQFWVMETPLANDQGIYNRITWWEQIDNEKQLTRNKKPVT